MNAIEPRSRLFQHSPIASLRHEAIYLNARHSGHLDTHLGLSYGDSGQP